MSELINQMKLNNHIMMLVNEVIWKYPDMIGIDEVKSFSEETNGKLDDALFYLFLAKLDIDFDDEEEKRIAELYFRNHLHYLKVDEYQKNDYCNKIKNLTIQSGKWQLKMDKIPAGTIFYMDDLDCFQDVECPVLGYFDQDFEYPAIYEDGLLWMSCDPSEINTMKKPIEEAYGHVLVLGLGLGYYPYFISQKEEVKKITIIEKEKDCIELFQNELIGVFDYANKIEVIHQDALEYLASISENEVDVVFADLWHNAEDGIKLYEKIKKYESKHTCTKFIYWLENSLKSKKKWNERMG